MFDSIALTVDNTNQYQGKFVATRTVNPDFQRGKKTWMPLRIWGKQALPNKDT